MCDDICKQRVNKAAGTEQHHVSHFKQSSLPARNNEGEGCRLQDEHGFLVLARCSVSP